MQGKGVTACPAWALLLGCCDYFYMMHVSLKDSRPTSHCIQLGKKAACSALNYAAAVQALHGTKNRRTCQPTCQLARINNTHTAQPGPPATH
jgi:hypothetical protein